MNRTRGGQRIIDTYETWGEFVDAAKTAEPSGAFEFRHSRIMTGHHSGTGVPSFEAAIDYATNGWPEGAAQVKTLSLSMFDRLATLIERPTVTYDVEGEQVDIARYLDGEPECWQRTEWKTTEGVSRRVVKVTFNYAVSSGVSQEVARAKGAAVVALCELLEHAGYGVELSVISSSNGYASGAHHTTFTPVKTADQPLDVSRAAFALASPAMHRCLWFALLEALPYEVAQALGCGSYNGTPCEAPASLRGDLHFGKTLYGEPQWTDPTAARAWIISQLKAQGVAVRETEDEQKTSSRHPPR